MDQEINSIEDIDNLLDSEFNIDNNSEDINDNAGNQQEVDIDVNDEDNDVDDNSDPVEDDNEDTNDEGNNVGSVDNSGGDNKKPTDIEKKEYAFGKIRQENANLKQEKQKLEQESAFLKELASSYGYSDVNKFKDDVRKARLDQEAKQKGIDPEIYRQLDDNKREIARLKAERDQDRLMSRATGFKSAVEEATNSYGVTRDEIFLRLEDAGYDVNTILSLPNPKIVIDGLLTDKILEASRQKDLKKRETMDNLADEKHDNSASEKEVTLDDLLKADMEAYKKANYL